MDQPVDPKAVIDDLLEQIKKLSLENSMMRVFLKSLVSDGTEVPTDS